MTRSLKWRLAQKLETFWWHWYLKSKTEDGYLEWKSNYWRNFLSLLENDISLKGSKILDAGCGPAGIFMVLNQHNVTALDPLLSTYENHTFFRKGNFPEVHFIEKTIEEFSTEDKFDIIFCVNAINHVNNIHKALNSLKMALKPNGVLVLTTDAHQYKALNKLFQLIPGDALHPHQYSKKEYKSIIERANLRIVSNRALKQEIIFSYELFILA